MSYNSFLKALKEMEKCEGYRFGTAHDKNVIRKAEELLGITFSKQIREYLSKYGYIEFFGVELYGIINESFILDDESNEGCMIEWTVDERTASGLNPKWVAIRFEDEGGMAFFDFSSLNSEGEPRVVLAIDCGDGYELDRVLADDFGDYLLDLVYASM